MGTNFRLEVNVEYVTLSLADFCEILGVDSLSKRVKEAFDAEQPITYRQLSEQETAEIVKEIYIKIEDPDTPQAGPGFKANWESNWNENLNRFKKSLQKDSLIPNFISSNETLRFKGMYIQPLVPNFEMKFVRVLREFLFEKYLSKISELHEFGAGTGFNCIHFGKIYPNKKIYGYDWSPSSIELIEKASKKFGVKIQTSLFDMFKPDVNVDIAKNSGLLTVGAMEQLGNNWEEFLNFMISKKFDIYINIETIYEKYLDGQVFSDIAKSYIERRNWLQGYFSKLYMLDQEGIIEILDQRVVVGSRFHDSWSYTVWKNKNV
jgi:SAM-dependent methyltransferase